MTTQPSIGKQGILRPHRMIVFGIALLVVLVVGGTLFTLAYFGKGTTGQKQPNRCHTR